MAVLYRKYRPQSWGDVIGQAHVVQTLTNAIKGKNISHAYLFSGPRGSGKTTIARLFAKSINCDSSINAEPCNKCSSCLEIIGGNAIDLIEIDAASHTGVDDVRQLIEGVKFAPVKSKYKVFIIDECHQLSKAASNALLKTLEEPPEHAVFILATTESYKMLATILSRCQRFDFRKLQASEIIEKLQFIAKKEGFKFDNDALSLIAFNARGSFRDAESLLDQCSSFFNREHIVKTDDLKSLLGFVEISKISEFVSYLSGIKIKEAIKFVDEFYESGGDLREFIKSLIFYLRQMMLFKIDRNLLNPQGSGFSAEEIEIMGKQAELLEQKKMQNMLEVFLEAESKMKYAPIIQLPLELAIIELSTAQEKQFVDNVL